MSIIVSAIEKDPEGMLFVKCLRSLREIVIKQDNTQIRGTDVIIDVNFLSASFVRDWIFRNTPKGQFFVVKGDFNGDKIVTETISGAVLATIPRNLLGDEKDITLFSEAARETLEAMAAVDLGEGENKLANEFNTESQLKKN